MCKNASGTTRKDQGRRLLYLGITFLAIEILVLVIAIIASFGWDDNIGT
jgi:hypothetical protein